MDQASPATEDLLMHQLPSILRRWRRACCAAVAAALITACVPAAGGPAAGPVAGPSTGTSVGTGWSVDEREHVDLWLHAFAMLTSDTARVPLFERDYRQRMTALKRQRNVYTSLDANQEKLSARFAANPSLTNAQFLALYFPSFPEIVNATNYFMQSQGDPRAASDPQVQSEIALLAANFPSPADRDWLRLFVQSLQDEDNRFYHSYWTSEQQARSATRSEVERRWRDDYARKFSGYLNNTQQSAGDFLLSLPLDGEGRTVNDSKRANIVATVFPTKSADALASMYVFAHEVVNKVTDIAIRDNTTPAEQRSGEVARYSANVTVRGGAMLLQRIAPELLTGYMRYYLHSIGSTSTATDPSAAFTSNFPIPTAIRDAIGRQLDVVLGGI